MPRHASSHRLPHHLQKVRPFLFSSEISDKGFIEFLKTVSKITQLKELKLNLMNN